MRLANYLEGSVIRAGIVENDKIYPVSAERDITVDRILASGARVSKVGHGVPVSSVRLLSPVLSPEKIFCIAANYWAHIKEGGAKDAEPYPEPYLFTKFKNALRGPGDPILLPKVSKEVDWEVELAVIIGKEGKYIKRENALQHVAGYAVSNDVSFRDFQASKIPEGKPNPFGMNWVLGKSMDGAFPLGPWLVTTDEIPDPQKLKISLAVNGVVKQSANTADMIYTVDRLVEYASTGITLRPGDIISTGTPSGVAAATGGPFLKDGDVLEGTIDKIGTLRNVAKAEA